MGHALGFVSCSVCHIYFELPVALACTIVRRAAGNTLLN
jgi:hypothetical protein